MNIWENAVITTKGLSLLSKLMEGNTLTITRAESGEGYVTPGLLVQQTYVTLPKQTMTFGPATYPEEGKCKITCYITNDNLSTGYTAKQIGIYAMDPDDGEILFFIAQSTSDKGTEVPSKAEMPGYSAEWTFYFQYGQADGVTVNVDATNMVSREEFNTFVTANTKALESKADNKDVEKLAEDLSSQIEGIGDDFSDQLFDGYIRNPEEEWEIDFDSWTKAGIYKVYRDYSDEQGSYILVVGGSEYYGWVTQYLISGLAIEFRSMDEGGIWSSWQTISVVKSDLDKRIKYLHYKDFGGPDSNGLYDEIDYDNILEPGIYHIAQYNLVGDGDKTCMLIVGEQEGIFHQTLIEEGTIKYRAQNDDESDENYGKWSDWAGKYPQRYEEWTFTLEDGSTVTKAVYVK